MGAMRQHVFEVFWYGVKACWVVWDRAERIPRSSWSRRADAVQDALTAARAVECAVVKVRGRKDGRVLREVACGANPTLLRDSPVRYPPSLGDSGAETEQLVGLWKRAYGKMTPWPATLLCFGHGTFTYVYDDFGATADCPMVEARLVVAYGRAAPHATSRTHEDQRLRRWVGPTNTFLGRRWDKGHFVAHSIGGRVDGWEVNVFDQLRSVNRGWSDEGKRYRSMEDHCAKNAGTFCFSRPIYENWGARPAAVEFGYRAGEGVLVVERFGNR